MKCTLSSGSSAQRHRAVANLQAIPTSRWNEKQHGQDGQQWPSCFLSVQIVIDFGTVVAVHCSRGII